MNEASEKQATQLPAAAPAAPWPQPEPAEEEGNVLRRIQLLMRGRYHWAILLAVILGAIGGTAGYFAITPVYESVGLLQFKPNLPTILYRVEDNQDRGGGFVAAEVQRMQSRRVLEMAMQDEARKRLAPETGSDSSLIAFRGGLSVDKLRDQLVVRIAFEHPEREVAGAAVQSLINAYTRVYREQNVGIDSNRLQTLEERRRSLTNELMALRQRVRAIADEFGSDALDANYQFKLQQMQSLEQAVKETEMQLALLGRSNEAAESAAGAQEPQDPQGLGAIPQNPGELTPEQIASVDLEMRELVSRRKQIENQIMLLLTRLGENHREVRELRSALETTETLIARRADEVGAEVLALINRSGGSVPGSSMVGQSEAQLRARLTQLADLYAQARAEVTDLGNKRMDIQDLHDQQRIVETRLAETKARIDALNLESTVGGELEIISNGDTSFSPINAKKRIQLTLGGTLGGAGLGVGIILLLGFIDRRFRSSDEASMSIGDIGLLGVLPTLPDDLADPAAARLASHSVHHIRNLLQLGAGHSQQSVYTVTSASAGSGKTSLTLALGMSFASSGARTLLVDCDLIGRKLSARLESINRRRIGDILQQHGLATPDQINEALELATHSNTRLGEALTQLGVINPEDLARALAMQEESSVGVLSAINGDPLASCVAKTAFPDLTVLPVGGATVSDLKRFTPGSVRRVLAEARDQYDVVLLDTGPVPGSVETSVFAAASDGVVFIVSRGDRRPDVDHAIDFLYGINARLTGYVFNRAEAGDTAISAISSSISARGDEFVPSSNGSAADPGSNGVRRRKLGPVADALGAHPEG